MPHVEDVPRLCPPPPPLVGSQNTSGYSNPPAATLAPGRPPLEEHQFWALTLGQVESQMGEFQATWHPSLLKTLPVSSISEAKPTGPAASPTGLFTIHTPGPLHGCSLCLELSSCYPDISLMNHFFQITPLPPALPIPTLALFFFIASTTT